ncbi:MAG: PH domain-containing protein [Anaerolineae bacterium]
MGFLDGWLGNATEVDVDKLAEQYAPLLVDGEQIIRAFVLVRDMFIFTNKRFVVIDRQGASGNKVEYHSIPYKSITHFAVETAGSFDRDAELKIWLSGMHSPLEYQLKKGVDVVGVQRMLAQFVLW